MLEVISTIEMVESCPGLFFLLLQFCWSLSVLSDVCSCAVWRRRVWLFLTLPRVCFSSFILGSIFWRRELEIAILYFWIREDWRRYVYDFFLWSYPWVLKQQRSCRMSKLCTHLYHAHNTIIMRAQIVQEWCRGSIVRKNMEISQVFKKLEDVIDEMHILVLLNGHFVESETNICWDLQRFVFSIAFMDIATSGIKDNHRLLVDSQIPQAISHQSRQVHVVTLLNMQRSLSFGQKSDSIVSAARSLNRARGDNTVRLQEDEERRRRSWQSVRACGNKRKWTLKNIVSLKPRTFSSTTSATLLCCTSSRQASS